MAFISPFQNKDEYVELDKIILRMSFTDLLEEYILLRDRDWGIDPKHIQEHKDRFEAVKREINGRVPGDSISRSRLDRAAFMNVPIGGSC